jgi:nitrite reductase/ring-hydroxylating ferredoxin subunit
VGKFNKAVNVTLKTVAGTGESGMSSRRWMQVVLSAVGLVVVVAMILAALNSCSSGQAQAVSAGNGQVSASNPASPVDPTTVTPQIGGDTVSIPLSAVKTKFNTRFAVTTAQGQASYMAYVWNGTVNVRADICPPCGSRSFKLTNGTLVCNSCGTVFDAVTGKGKSGACVRYSKESVAYQVSGDSIVMKMADLTTAYNNTLAPD